MKIKTSELTGAALDWAVGKADGRRIRQSIGGGLEARGRTESGAELPDEYDIWMIWTPSACWSQGGPIIERERIRTQPIIGIHTPGNYGWSAGKWLQFPDEFQGPTPLIAAMRCFVASTLGDEIEIPDELVSATMEAP